MIASARMRTAESAGYRIGRPDVWLGSSWSHSARLKSAVPSSRVENEALRPEVESTMSTRQRPAVRANAVETASPDCTVNRICG